MDSSYSGICSLKTFCFISLHMDSKNKVWIWQNTLSGHNIHSYKIMSRTQMTIKSKLLGYLYVIWQEHLITCIAVSQYYSNIHIASFVLHIYRTFWKP